VICSFTDMLQQVLATISSRVCFLQQVLATVLFRYAQSSCFFLHKHILAVSEEDSEDETEDGSSNDNGVDDVAGNPQPRVVMPHFRDHLSVRWCLVPQRVCGFPSNRVSLTVGGRPDYPCYHWITVVA